VKVVLGCRDGRRRPSRSAQYSVVVVYSETISRRCDLLLGVLATCAQAGSDRHDRQAEQSQHHEPRRDLGGGRCKLAKADAHECTRVLVVGTLVGLDVGRRDTVLGVVLSPRRTGVDQADGRKHSKQDRSQDIASGLHE